jgi:hypothetical protein
MQIRFFLAFIILGAASVALAQQSAPDVAKIAAMLKQLDKNGNGIIDQDEADNGAGPYLERRVFGPAKVQPHYPISIAELMQLVGGEAPTDVGSGSSASPAPASSPAPAQPSTPAPSAAAPTAPSQPSTTPAPTTPSAGSATPAAPSTSPAPSASPSMPGPRGPMSTTPSSTQKQKIRWANPKERLPKGLPDWFLSKMDSDGQITMANYTNNWTPEAVKQFEKYDLNHDGIITAAEVMKVEKSRGGR